MKTTVFIFADSEKLKYTLTITKFKMADSIKRVYNNGREFWTEDTKYLFILKDNDNQLRGRHADYVYVDRRISENEQWKATHMLRQHDDWKERLEWI